MWVFYLFTAICYRSKVLKRNSSNLESMYYKNSKIRRHKCSNSIVNGDVVDSCDKFNLCRNLTVCTRYVLIFWNMQLQVNSFPVLHPLSKANYLMHNIRLTMAYVCRRQFHAGIILIIFDHCNIWDNQAMSQFDYSVSKKTCSKFYSFWEFFFTYIPY